MKEKVNPLVKEWLNKAKSDLKYAEVSFEEFDDFYSQMCILCHDSAEKYLKAYLYANKISPPKIHDLVNLIKKCVEVSPDNKALQRIVHHCRELNFYYIPLKYPSHYPSLTREKAEEAIKSAKQIERTIIRIIFRNNVNDVKIRK